MADHRALVPSRDHFSGSTSCSFLGCFSISKCKWTYIISNNYNLVSANLDFFGHHSVLSENGHTGVPAAMEREMKTNMKNPKIVQQLSHNRLVLKCI